MKFTDKQTEIMNKDLQRIMEQLKDGKTAKEAAAQLYVEALPYKEAELGEVMADRIEEIINDYERLKKDALAQPDSWLEKQIAQQCKEDTCQERCRVMIHMLAGMTALNASVAGETVRTDYLMNTAFDESRATPELEAELMAELKNAVENCTLGAKQLEVMAEALDSAEIDEMEDRILAFGKDAHDRKLLLAMIAYVNIKSGTFEAPAEATVEDITTSVCLLDDTLQVARDVQEGRISEEEAPEWLRILGGVAAVTMITALLMFIMHVNVVPLLMGTVSVTAMGLLMAIISVIVTVENLLCADEWYELGEKGAVGLWRWGQKTGPKVRAWAQRVGDKITGKSKQQQAEEAIKSCDRFEQMWMNVHVPMEYMQHMEMYSKTEMAKG